MDTIAKITAKGRIRTAYNATAQSYTQLVKLLGIDHVACQKVSEAIWQLIGAYAEIDGYDTADILLDPTAILVKAGMLPK